MPIKTEAKRTEKRCNLCKSKLKGDRGQWFRGRAPAVSRPPRQQTSAHRERRPAQPRSSGTCSPCLPTAAWCANTRRKAHGGTRERTHPAHRGHAASPISTGAIRWTPNFSCDHCCRKILWRVCEVSMSSNTKSISRPCQGHQHHAGGSKTKFRATQGIALEEDKCSWPVKIWNLMEDKL